MECFFPNQQISKIHGQPKRVKGQVYLPLFHPAAALYNGMMRQELINDYQAIPETLRLIRKGK
jgi:DNA polymerase